jgi:GMP synthase-like glutamine amidotransferase
MLESGRALYVANCELETLGRYGALIDGHGYGRETCAAYRDEVLPDPRDYDLIVVGGTPLSAYEAERHPFMRRELKWLERVVESGTACLGICCGAQMLAQVLGARVYRNKSMEIGIVPVHLTEEGRRDPALRDFPREFSTFQWHGDGFEIPPGALHLAGSDVCPHQMYRWGHVVGAIFHLEISAREADAWLEAYASELPRVGKSAADVAAECAAADAEIDGLAARFVANLLGRGSPS